MRNKHSFMGVICGAALLLLSSHALAQDSPPENIDQPVFEPEVFAPPVFEVPEFEMPVFETPDIALPDLEITDIPSPPENAESLPSRRDVNRSEASQPERVGTDWLTEVYDRILPNAEDSWVLTIHKTRAGHDIYRSESPAHGYWSNTHNEWYYGPASVSVRLATYDSADQYGEHGILVQLALWQHWIAQWLEDIKTKESYGPIADEAQSKIDYAKLRFDDAEMLIRVLQGLQHYAVIEKRYDPLNTKPISNDSVVHLEGATFTVTQTSSAEEPSTQTASMPRWSSSDFDDMGNAPHRRYGAVIWRFVPEDMARVAALIEDYDDIRDEMTLDISDADLPDNLASMRDWVPKEYHAKFRDPLLAALHEVARIAWWIGPYKAPDTNWATSEDQLPDGLQYQWEVTRDDGERLVDRAGTPFFNKTTQLKLPPLETDTLVMLNMSVFGITEEPGEIPSEPYFSGLTTISNEYRAKHSFNPGFPQRERITHKQLDDFFWARTIVHSAGNGEKLDGRVNITSEHYDIYVNEDGDHRRIRDQRQTHNVIWSLSHDGDVWAPGPPDIAASFVQPDGSGGFEPLTENLDYGTPFAVEGRLELPAARQVYNLEIDYGGDRPHDVLLYPTEEDRTVLRSDILYLMWDVAHAEASVAGAEASQ
ncbi:hypothetical protein NBRC116588_30440 [Pyruvatibacter sp. HU-CL02332]|uniref:hypothetical protein n=1 Tax=Pyruvatibacter sp. HU-CL02332 TaxID=3127650 RepID=UPI003109A478